ncbi:DUF6454 family protein [Streptomyces meridianus]|uniref:DUF6454 family protein n=1 Tax=Streptomyces meridianus TaxID=2938945 RepID=A0ABT0X3M1_9ACTN|nr:DUF6454 family protein [Streptomyces meridianus]MCM2577123.1 DUF6454 family protein [Streptomyces meridianus]
MRTRLALAATLSLAVIGGTTAIATATPPTPYRDGNKLTPAAQSFTKVTRDTQWKLTRKVRLDFPTYHPQGFALAGDLIFMSSVQIDEKPEKYPEPVDGYDRSTGKGVGHVLVMTREGKLVKDIVVGEGTMYHPGGIDFDGESVWVPVAEYRPNSQSIMYRIDAKSLQVREAFRHRDHVGGAVFDRSSGKVHGVGWGSRKFFTWTQKGDLLRSAANPSHLIDHQDCDYAGAGNQLCSGVTELPTADGGKYELGGLALIDPATDRIRHEVPFPHFSAAGHAVTRNPVALETQGSTLRLLAAPDDAEEASGTDLLVYEATP